jgi:hypothetical protein
MPARQCAGAFARARAGPSIRKLMIPLAARAARGSTVESLERRLGPIIITARLLDADRAANRVRKCRNTTEEA